MNTNQRQTVTIALVLVLLLFLLRLAATKLPGNSSDTAAIQQPPSKDANSNVSEDSLMQWLREKKDQLQAMENELKIKAEQLRAKEQQLQSVTAKLGWFQQWVGALAAILLLIFAGLIILLMNRNKKVPGNRN